MLLHQRLQGLLDVDGLGTQFPHSAGIELEEFDVCHGAIPKAAQAGSPRSDCHAHGTGKILILDIQWRRHSMAVVMKVSEVPDFGRRNDLLIRLGKRIHELRAARKWSQEEFVHVSGFHRTYIGQIERGEKNMSSDNLARVANSQEVTLSAWLDGLENGSAANLKSLQGNPGGPRRAAQIPGNREAGPAPQTPARGDEPEDCGAGRSADEAPGPIETREPAKQEIVRAPGVAAATAFQ